MTKDFVTEVDVKIREVGKSSYNREGIRDLMILVNEGKHSKMGKYIFR